MTESDFIKFFLMETAQDNIKPHTDEVRPPLEQPCPSNAQILRLPEPELLPDVSINFLELIELRSSVRQFSEKSITLNQLSFMLWCTQGVKMVLPQGVTMRNVPSAGASHAFETYLLIQRVEGLKPGLYRFLALGHALQVIRLGEDVIEEAAPLFNAKNMVHDSAVTFLWTADLKRMSYKYGLRGTRYLSLDAGHVCQNLYLAAYVQKIGTCALGAFDDISLNAFLGLDGENDFIVYGASVGKAQM